MGRIEEPKDRVIDLITPPFSHSFPPPPRALSNMLITDLISATGHTVDAVRRSSSPNESVSIPATLSAATDYLTREPAESPDRLRSGQQRSGQRKRGEEKGDHCGICTRAAMTKYTLNLTGSIARRYIVIFARIVPIIDCPYYKPFQQQKETNFNHSTTRSGVTSSQSAILRHQQIVSQLR